MGRMRKIGKLNNPCIKPIPMSDALAIISSIKRDNSLHYLRKNFLLGVVVDRTERRIGEPKVTING